MCPVELNGEGSMLARIRYHTQIAAIGEDHKMSLSLNFMVHQTVSTNRNLSRRYEICQGVPQNTWHGTHNLMPTTIPSAAMKRGQ